MVCLKAKREIRLASGTEFPGQLTTNQSPRRRSRQCSRRLLDGRKMRMVSRPHGKASRELEAAMSNSVSAASRPSETASMGRVVTPIVVENVRDVLDAQE